MLKINCAFIASYFGPYYSNFVASIFSFDSEMKTRGATVIYVFPKDIIQYNWVEKLKHSGAIIQFIDYAPYTLNNYRKIKRIIKEYKINVIYSHMCGWDFTAHFANIHVPIIWHMRMGVSRNKIKTLLLNYIKFRIIANRNVYHIGVSESVTNAINSYKPKNKCILIENALDFSRLKIKNDLIKNKIEPIRALIFGWDPYIKGLDYTLDTFELLNQEKTIIQLVVSAQNKTKEYLDKRYTKYPEWLVIKSPTDDVSSLYQYVDIMISASRSEGFSFSLAEAIYCGLPAVVSDIEGTKWVEKFKSIYLFKTGDIFELKSAIEMCINKNISNETRLYNKSLMESNYSIDKWKKKVVDYIFYILNK